MDRLIDRLFERDEDGNLFCEPLNDLEFAKFLQLESSNCDAGSGETAFETFQTDLQNAVQKAIEGVLLKHKLDLEKTIAQPLNKKVKEN